MRHSASLQLKGLQNCGRSKLKAKKDIHVSGEEFFFIFVPLTLTSYSFYPLELQERVLAHSKVLNDPNYCLLFENHISTLSNFLGLQKKFQ